MAHVEPSVEFRIQGEVVPYVQSAVYLGVECDASRGVIFDKKHQERCAKVVNTAKYLKSKGMNALGWRTNTKVLAYKSFLRPMMEYGLPFMPARCKMLDTMEVTQNTVMNMMLSTARCTSRGAKLKLLQIESMGFRREKLQHMFFHALDQGNPSDAVAYLMWHAIKGNRGQKSSLALAVNSNRIFEFAKAHESNEVGDYAMRLKFESMQKFDAEKNGKRDMAASVRTPTGKASRSAYLDPKHIKADQHVVTMLRVGSLTFHQACARCGTAVSRAHAWECSGEERKLKDHFPREWHEFEQYEHRNSLIFPDFVMNKMDDAYESRHTDYGDVIFRTILDSAKTIRDVVSGYVRSEDGRTWSHPLNHATKGRPKRKPVGKDTAKPP